MYIYVPLLSLLLHLETLLGIYIYTIYICIYIFIYMYIRICMYIYINIYRYISIYVHIYIYIHIYTYTYVYTYIYEYIYVNIAWYSTVLHQEMRACIDSVVYIWKDVSKDAGGLGSKYRFPLPWNPMRSKHIHIYNLFTEL
jgi:hypothetical protein